MQEFAESIGEEAYSPNQIAKFIEVSRTAIVKVFDSRHLKGFVIPGSKYRRIPTKCFLEFIVENNLEHAFKNYQNYLTKKGYDPSQDYSPKQNKTL